jgi:hypothetical protein
MSFPKGRGRGTKPTLAESPQVMRRRPANIDSHTNILSASDHLSKYIDSYERHTSRNPPPPPSQWEQYLASDDKAHLGTNSSSPLPNPPPMAFPHPFASSEDRYERELSRSTISSADLDSEGGTFPLAELSHRSQDARHRMRVEELRRLREESAPRVGKGFATSQHFNGEEEKKHNVGSIALKGLEKGVSSQFAIHSPEERIAAISDTARFGRRKVRSGVQKPLQRWRGRDEDSSEDSDKSSRGGSFDLDASDISDDSHHEHDLRHMSSKQRSRGLAITHHRRDMHGDDYASDDNFPAWSHRSQRRGRRGGDLNSVKEDILSNRPPRVHMREEEALQYRHRPDDPSNDTGGTLKVEKSTMSSYPTVGSEPMMVTNQAPPAPTLETPKIESLLETLVGCLLAKENATPNRSDPQASSNPSIIGHSVHKHLGVRGMEEEDRHSPTPTPPWHNNNTHARPAFDPSHSGKFVPSFSRLHHHHHHHPQSSGVRSAASFASETPISHQDIVVQQQRQLELMGHLLHNVLAGQNPPDPAAVAGLLGFPQFAPPPPPTLIHEASSSTTHGVRYPSYYVPTGLEEGRPSLGALSNSSHSKSGHPSHTTVSQHEHSHHGARSTLGNAPLSPEDSAPSLRKPKLGFKNRRPTLKPDFNPLKGPKKSSLPSTISQSLVSSTKSEATPPENDHQNEIVPPTNESKNSNLFCVPICCSKTTFSMFD